MSNITNPPLEPGRDDAGSPANEHTTGPTVNPPLEGSHLAASAADLQNPRLDGGSSGSEGHAPASDNPALDSPVSSVAADGLNPPLDESDIERWFERQLEPGAPAAPPAQPGTKKALAKTAGAAKQAAKKRATKRVAKKRSSPAKSATKTK